MAAHRRAKADLGPGLGSFACVKGAIIGIVAQMDRGTTATHAGKKANMGPAARGLPGGVPDPGAAWHETHIIPASLFGEASREGVSGVSHPGG